MSAPTIWTAIGITTGLMSPFLIIAAAFTVGAWVQRRQQRAQTRQAIVDIASDVRAMRDGGDAIRTEADPHA